MLAREALLTSAEANEVAFEDEKCGGEVFTYFLLERMRGNADMSPQDEIVTVSELFDYVHEKVQNAILILDCNSNSKFLNIARNDGMYTLMVRATQGKSSHEYTFEGGKRKIVLLIISEVTPDSAGQLEPLTFDVSSYQGTTLTNYMKSSARQIYLMIAEIHFLAGKSHFHYLNMSLTFSNIRGQWS